MPACKEISRTSRWLPLIVWMAVIALFSTDDFSSGNTGSIIEPIVRIVMGKSYTVEAFEAVHYFIRKSAHVTEYAILGALCFRALNQGLIGWHIKSATLSFFFAGTYAALDEFHQAFTLNRGASPVDVMIDSAGVITALTVIWIFNKWFARIDNDCK